MRSVVAPSEIEPQDEETRTTSPPHHHVLDGSNDNQDHDVVTVEDNGDNEALEKKPAPPVVFFAERSEAFSLIQQLNTNDDDNQSAVLDRLQAILHKYLECPTLLDGSLEEMVVLLGNLWLEQQQKSCWMIVLYSLCKVRGRKVVQRFLPHTTSVVAPVWQGLQDCYCTTSTSAVSLSDQGWKETYCLWIWMGMLSRVPFDSHLLLSSSNGCQELIALAQTTAMRDAGPVREAAAEAIAAWLIRPDWEGELLEQYMEWIRQQFLPNNSSEQLLFVRLGALQTVVTVLKTFACADRTRLSQQLHALSLVFASMTTTTTTQQKCSTTSTRMDHFLVKWWTRWSCWHLPAPRRRRNFQQGQQQRCLYSSSSLNAGKEVKQTIDDSTHTKGSNGGEAVVVIEEDEEPELWEIPSFVEDAMDYCINHSLHHASTSVRWAAAKGIGRIAERLPGIAVQDVVEAVLSTDTMGSHGSCLALAELARRGLLHPSRVQKYVLHSIQHASPVVRDACCYLYWALCRSYPPGALAPFLPAWNAAMVVTALLDREVNCRRAAAAAFQEAVGRQGARNVPHGLAILTAADYFSLGNRRHAYTVVAVQVAALSEFYQRAIVRRLYTCQLFHEDITIRTVSSEALFHLTPLDPQYVASTVVVNLLGKCWDPQVKIRHGAILGTAECIVALSAPTCGDLPVTDLLSEETIRRLVELVPELEKRRLYRGRGGEYVRLAVCRLVEAIALCSIPLLVPNQVRLLDSIDGHIPHPNVTIQRKACVALSALMSEYFPIGRNGQPSERLQKRVVDKFIFQARTSTNPATTRGYCLALGHLPAKLVAPNDLVLSKVIQCLSSISNPTALVGGEGDAETRRNALQSLSRIIDIVGFTSQPSTHVVPLSARHVESMAKTFLLSLDDYKTDNRGDVGSWCRMEAMSGMTRLVLATPGLAGESNNVSVPEALITNAVRKMLRQLVEKLDVVRVKAGECLERIVMAKDTHFLEKDALTNALSLSNGDKSNWRDIKGTYTRVVEAVKVKPYSKSILSGFAASIGGLSEQVSSCASQTLIRWIKGSSSCIQTAVGLCFVDILETKYGGNRLVLPMLKTLDVTLTNGCFVSKANGDGALVHSFIERVHNGMSGTKNIQYLLVAIDIFTTIAGIEVDESSRKKGLALLCSMLLHPYPRVRSYASDHLLLLDRVDPVVDCLLETPWGSESSLEEERSAAVETIAKGLQVGHLLKELAGKAI